MKLMYHSDWRGNFGDDLNIPFFNGFIKNLNEVFPEKKLYGIGTLLNDVHGDISDSIIFGSGFGYGNSININWENTKVFGVRGPLTAKKLGLDASEYVIGDPAMYADQIHSFECTKPFPYKKVVALHHKSSELWDFSKNNSTDLYFLDPGAVSMADYISIIRGAEIVYAESLHGAIMAATYGIPFYPISIKTTLEAQKWADFYGLFNIEMPTPFKALVSSVPLLRRVQVSAKARRLWTPPKEGNILPTEYFDDFSKDILSANLHNKMFVSDPKVIFELRSKIAIALEKFIQYCDQN